MRPRTREVGFDWMERTDEGVVVGLERPEGVDVHRLGDDFQPAERLAVLPPGSVVLGSATGRLWYALDTSGDERFALFALGEKPTPRRFARMVPCGVLATRHGHVALVGVFQDRLIWLGDGTIKASPPGPVLGLPVIHPAGVNCLYQDRIGAIRLWTWEPGQRPRTWRSDPLKPSTSLACRLPTGGQVISVERSAGGHVALVELEGQGGCRSVLRPRDPWWPISLQILSDHAVLHISSRGRRRAVAIAPTGEWVAFDSWRRPIGRDGAVWLVRNEELRGRVCLKSKSLARARPLHLSWVGEGGLGLGGWLTAPPHPGGAVLLLHGGPIGSADHPFNRWSRLLVDAGYAVLQPNLPGSTGYGDGLLQALRSESWLHGFHEEVRKAASVLASAVSRRPSDVVLMGESFGGYAALFSGAKTCRWRPRAVVSVNGFFDLVMDQATSDPEVRATMQDWLGPPEADPVRYWLASPINWLHAGMPPTLLIASACDTNVAPANSYALHRRLANSSVPSLLVKLAAGTHNYWPEEASRGASEAVLGFLSDIQSNRLPPPADISFLRVAEALTDLCGRNDLFDPISNPHECLAVRCLRALAVTNRRQWELEDKARAPDQSLAEVGELKRQIDRHNQRRHHLIADIGIVLASLAPRPRLMSRALRTETPGSTLDRLTILRQRLGVLEGVPRSTRQQQAIEQTRSQVEGLREALSELFTEVAEGRAEFVACPSWKLYNHPH